MHIGIITGEYPPMEGGVGDYTRALSSALMHLGHQVDILTSQTLVTHDQDESGPIADFRIKKWSAANSYPIIHRWLRKTAPDIVNIQYQAAAYQMKGSINLLTKWITVTRFNTPTVVTYHDLLPPYLFPKAGSLRGWSVRYLAENACGVIVTNEADRQELTRSLSSGDPPIATIPIGSNIPTQLPVNYSPQTWRNKYGIADSDLLLGFFGFMNRGKGVDILLTAVAALLDDQIPVKLVFIGGRTGSSDRTNTEYADYIDTIINEKGLQDHIVRTGYVTPEEVSAALHTIDICPLPYLEGASLRHGTLHAALSHGCAIITTSSSHVHPGLEDAVKFIPPNDSIVLKESIAYIWENQNLRQSLQSKALALSENFGWDNIAEKTLSFFSKCINKCK
jgi:glycosyltransferase involved in cell wall biosynthesis